MTKTKAVSVTETAQLIADKALTWLHANRALGAFPAETSADLVSPDSVYKPLGESALASSLVLRDARFGSGRQTAAQSLLDFAWQQLREGDLLYERQVQYPHLSDPLELYAHFARGGYRHTNLDRVLAHNARLGSVHASEMMPNRRLAVANAYQVLGIEFNADWDALTRATWLGATPEPWAIDWFTGYCVTHTVFHLTDWGARPQGLPAELTSYLHNWLPVWLDIWSEVGQWDLMTELLIVDACLEEPYFPVQYWDVLAALQHQDGFVPRDSEPVAEDPQQRFQDSQHTVVVAAVAGSIAVMRTLS